MEYTDYFVAKGDVTDVVAAIEKHADQAVLLDEEPPFFPFVSNAGEKAFLDWEWLLSIFDAEGGAWGFEFYQSGTLIGEGTFGENSEWGISRSMNGFKGDLEKTAAGLGITVEKLEGTFNDDGVDDFCSHIGFTHAYMLYPHEPMPDGVTRLSDLV